MYVCQGGSAGPAQRDRRSTAVAVQRVIAGGKGCRILPPGIYNGLCRRPAPPGPAVKWVRPERAQRSVLERTMPSTHLSLNFHVIFSTDNRMPEISELEYEQRYLW